LQKYLKIIGAILLIFLTSCTQSEISKNERTNTNNQSVVISFENPQTKQKYEIVNAYKLFSSYRNKVKNKPNNSQLEIYKQEVIDPIYNQCFKNGEYLHMVDSILNTAPTRFTEIQFLSKKIEKEETDQAIKEALIKSSNLLPSKKETIVCIFPSMYPISATMITAGAGKIIVLYNSYYTKETLKVGIAHEYHHSVWTERYLRKNTPSTVLDNLIFEGKAIMFEKVVYPDVEFTPIDPIYNTEDWSKIEPDLEKKDLNRSLEIILGGNGLPRLYGYSEGYKMVNSYLKKNLNLTPEQWTPISAKDIFEKGNYVENYK
jgi:hypothetical protein